MAEQQDMIEAARGGDRRAMTQIYDRHGAAVYDYCYNVIRDRDVAAIATTEIFQIVFVRLPALADTAQFRTWLYAIARREARRHAEDVERAAVAAGPRSKSDARSQAGNEKVVWEALHEFGPVDRALLFLSVRAKLEGDALAQSIGTDTSTAYTVTGRLRDRVTSRVGAALVARVGRRECKELDELLTGWDSDPDGLAARKVPEHIRTCANCKRTQQSLGNPLIILSGMALAVPPSNHRDQVIEAIGALDAQDEASLAAAVPGLDWKADKLGYPPPLPVDVDDDGSRGPLPLILAIAAVLLLLAGGAFVLLSGDDGQQVNAAGGEDGELFEEFGGLRRTTTTTSTTTTSTTTTTTTAPPVTAAPPPVGPAPVPVPVPVPVAPVPVPVAPTPGPSPQPGFPPPPPPAAGFQQSWNVSYRALTVTSPCGVVGYSQNTGIFVDVTATTISGTPPPITRVYVTWKVKNNKTGGISAPFTNNVAASGANHWAGTVGQVTASQVAPVQPSGYEGAVNFDVHVVDSTGKDSIVRSQAAINVDACPS